MSSGQPALSSRNAGWQARSAALRHVRFAQFGTHLVPARLRDERAELVGGVVLRHVVDVDHGRLDVGVAHIDAYVGKRERLGRERPERVPEIVEDEWLARAAITTYAGLLHRGVEPVAHPRVV